MGNRERRQRRGSLVPRERCLQRQRVGDEQVVEVDAPLVEVDDADHELDGVAGDGKSQEEHRPRDAAHVLGELLVVEVDLSNDGERLGEIPADTGITNPHPREYFCARARARHPSRAA